MSGPSTRLYNAAWYADAIQKAPEHLRSVRGLTEQQIDELGTKVPRRFIYAVSWQRSSWRKAVPCRECRVFIKRMGGGP